MLETKNKSSLSAGRKKAIMNKILLAMAILGLLFFNLKDSYALDFGKTDCDKYDGSLKDECEKWKDTKTIINLKTKQEATIKNQLDLINVEQSRNQTELQKSKKVVQDLSQQIQDLDQKIQEKTKLLEYQKNILSRLIQSYYEDYQQGVLDVVLADEKFSDIFGQSDYIEHSSLNMSEVIKNVQDIKNNLQSEQADLEQKKTESEGLKQDLQQKNLNLQYTEDKKQILLGQTQADKAKYEQLLSDIEDEINQLDSSKGEADLSKLPPIKKGYFTYPVNPVKITQGYGKTSFSKHYTTGKHNGVDFSAKYQNVFAAKAGKVLATGNNGRYGYGKWVAIDHGDGLVTLYGHFSKQLVSKGDSVKEGGIIGISGNTGYSTGPHVHFSVFSKSSFDVVESTKVSGLMLPTGASVNPMRYF